MQALPIQQQRRYYFKLIATKKLFSKTNCTEQSGDVVGGLVEDKVELSISLVHLVSFQQAETSSSQQMVLNKNTIQCI